jgi:hypothetical protein
VDPLVFEVGASLGDGGSDGVPLAEGVSLASASGSSSLSPQPASRERTRTEAVASAAGRRVLMVV